MPGEVNWKLYELPGMIDPLLNNPAVSLVTVCVTGSLLVHLTVVFTETVSVTGLKASSWIYISFDCCTEVVVNVISLPYAVPELFVA